MPSFKQITVPADLPREGTTYEQLSVDFKAKVDAEDPFELAKDVAAFGNASGGVVLVRGAAPSDKLERYIPFPSREEALALREAYARAVRDRCYPPPVIDPVVLPHADGFLVAVNVLPFPGQPIGVWVRGDKTDGYGEKAYTFPVRVGVHTVFFRPEQLPMLMVAEVRRVVALLESVPLGQFVVSLETDELPRPHSCCLKSLLVQENTAAFTRESSGHEVITVPIDAVRSVWKTDLGKWVVALAGSLVSPTSRGGGTGEWRFRPR